MPYKKLILAVVFSIPLLPFLFISTTSLDQSISGKNVILAAPFVIEFMSFYFVFAFAGSKHGVFTKDEQKSLLILALGVFVLLSIPVIWTVATDPSVGFSKTGFFVTMLYAFVSLALNIMKITGSPKDIRGYFVRGYILPGTVAVTLCVTLALIAATTINPVVAYFMIKNFVFALK